MSETATAVDVTMPGLSEGMETGTIIAWLIEDGATVNVGDDLLEVETDKAAMTVEAEAAGILRIVVGVNQSARVGDVIARIGDAPTGPEAAAPPPAPAASAEPAPLSESHESPSPATAATNGNADSSVRVSPVARRVARQHGVDLTALTGTGPGGRIVRSDVEQAAGLPATPAQADASAPAAAPAATAPSAERSNPRARTAKGDVRVEELTRVQTVVARRMSESKATAPEFILGVDVDMEEAMALRTKLKALAGDAKPPSYNDLVIKASALALREFPRANGAYVDGHFELYENINVGMAVAANDALIVPTIFDADKRSIGEIGRESRRLADRVRDGQVTPPELAGGTFTVSNLGMFGISEFVSILNPPQAAILSVGEMKRKPVEWEDEVALRHVMKLRLSCDHRILYGADAAGFLSRIKVLLQNPLGMAL
ncbi:Dihydrolipoyllysine-residue acetyltransferase component of pyruvate dehydrogenase complex [Paraconexibacter sp. AEG42_29]|uniref:Dihydrolipoamide acetyltransferase component of pyruvate dehydrogenase complex n=1 Tax=Paraconexibacter sp. AEG42_29 TaxID=2997339 RepID=A0AAU7AYN6_9ACTN